MPSPAANTIADTVIVRPSQPWRRSLAASLRGEESNPYSLNQNQASCRLNDPGPDETNGIAGLLWDSGALPEGSSDSVTDPMGSLIKKRRKRMRKKKHKKMLRRTRHQRRK